MAPPHLAPEPDMEKSGRAFEVKVVQPATRCKDKPHISWLALMAPPAPDRSREPAASCGRPHWDTLIITFPCPSCPSLCIPDKQAKCTAGLCPPGPCTESLTLGSDPGSDMYLLCHSGKSTQLFCAQLTNLSVRPVPRTWTL